MTGKSKIFIIEDELLTAEGIKESLLGSGYSVTGMAATGADALEQIGKNRPDLALVDIKLKGDMDGIETARLLKLCVDIPVIYITAFSDPTIVERASHTGPYGYIIKPFGVLELITNIEIALHRHADDRSLKESECGTAHSLTS
jgi:two-component system, response regulator PdtaR